MIGDERVRFCAQCELHVFNLSAMSRAEAEHLIAGAESRLCVRFYRRRDGSIITQDCPIGLRALKLRALRIRKAVAAALFGFFAGAGGTVAVRGVGPITDWPLSWRSETMMGSIAEPAKPVVSGQEVGQLSIKEPQPRTHSKRHRR
jgi:hypothetical protein